jgi:hypothetical protein
MEDLEMRRLFSLTLGLTLSSLAVSATTWTVKDPTWELDANGKTYDSQAACVAASQTLAAATYHCTGSNVATIVGSSSTVGSGGGGGTGGGTGTSNGTSWVYHNGTFYWPGDWSWSGLANYKDTAGRPRSGTFDIAFNLQGQWGGWQPFAPNRSFSLSPYKYLTLSIKTTVQSQPIHIFFEAANDKPIGTFIDPVQGGFGPSPVVGQWTTYKIPLSAFGVSGATILKFGVQDDSGGSNNTFYIDDVGFTAS